MANKAPIDATIEDEKAAESSEARRAAAVREVVFAPIRGEGLAQQAVRRIAEGIALGLLRTGDRLPPEIELASWLGISPMTLREALAILGQTGYIERVRGKGGGTFIRSGPQPPSTATARQVLEKMTVEFVTDYTGLRRAISGEASALAAERAAPEAVDHFRGLVKSMQEVMRFEPYRQLDAALHIGIACAAQSEHLAAMEAKLQVELSEMFAAMYTLLPRKADPVLLPPSNREHEALIDAIAAGDADAAREVALAHVTGTRDLIIAMGSTVRGKRPAAGRSA